jgi:transcriptional regulator with XRE-family HTH domain
MLRFNLTRMLRAVLVFGLVSAMTLPAAGADVLADQSRAETTTCTGSSVRVLVCQNGREMIRTESPDRRKNRRHRPTDEITSEESPYYAEVAGQIGPTYGEWLRIQLKVRRMTQRLLAQRSGVDHSSISRILRGHRSPTLRTATALVRGLHGEFDHGALVPRNIPATARVEYALRSDELLTEDQIEAIMRSYLAMRAHDATGPEALPISYLRRMSTEAGK